MSKGRFPITDTHVRMNAGESIPAWRPARLRGMHGAPLVDCGSCDRTQAQHGCEPARCKLSEAELERAGLDAELAAEQAFSLDPQAQSWLELGSSS